VIAPLLALALISVAAAGIEGDEEEEALTAVPEPMLLESITDVDLAHAGELEMDIDFSIVPSVANSIIGGRFESEWRASQRVGLALELSFAREARTSDNYAFGARAAASFVLLHDFARNLHLQAVLAGRAPLETDESIAHDAAETSLPFAGGIHAAIGLGPLSLRAQLLGEAGEGNVAHAPVHAGIVALLRVDDLGFFGAEWIQDWALERPFTVAPEVVFDGATRRLPFRVGMTVPIHLGVERNQAFNVITRIILELD
jgi:hypothetical protein